MKYIIEKYTKDSRRFNFDVEVTKSMVDAVKKIDGVESAHITGRYDFTAWIGKCFEIEVVVTEILKICNNDFPLLKENGLLNWVPNAVN